MKRRIIRCRDQSRDNRSFVLETGVYKKNRKLTRHLRSNLSVISFSMECPEAVERGRNFRLLAEEELSKLLDFLTEYLPDSLKVNILLFRMLLFVSYYT